jgi:hypothetical protein
MATSQRNGEMEMIGLSWLSGREKERSRLADAIRELIPQAEAIELWIDGREAKVLLNYIADRLAKNGGLLSLEVFRATRTRVDSAEMDRCDYHVEGGEEGYRYAGSLIIEDTTTWPEHVNKTKLKRYYLLLGNCEYESDTLETLEEKLYQYYRAEFGG